MLVYRRVVGIEYALICQNNELQLLCLFTWRRSTVPETNISPENRPFDPKGNDRLPNIHFHGLRLC